MQLGLALLAFTLAIPSRNCFYAVRHGVAIFWSGLARKRGKRPLGTDPNLKNNSLIFDPAAAIVPAVKESQRSQCWFMLATNLASLFLAHSGGFDATSFQSLYNTYVFIKVIAIGGYLPVTFGLFTLRMVNEVSCDLIMLFVASVALAMGNLYHQDDEFKRSQEDLRNSRDQSLSN